MPRYEVFRLEEVENCAYIRLLDTSHEEVLRETGIFLKGELLNIYNFINGLKWDDFGAE